MRKYIKEFNIKYMLIIYIVIYAVFGIIFSSLTTQAPFGEFDEYTLMTASMLNDGNFSITDTDLEYAGTIFPELKTGYGSVVKLSGYIANDGGELSYYAPTYSLMCLPMVQVLLWLGLPAIYGFAYTNVLCVCALAFVIILSANVTTVKKILLTLILTINPIIFYYTWQSAEVFMYAALGLAVFAWINKKYKIGGIFVSLVGSLNPTAMVVGIFMILDYFLELFFENKDELLKERCIRILGQWKDILLYASTFLIALVPYAYNFYYSGSISLPASRGTIYSVDAFAYFKAYLFDWNFGILPYYTFFLVLFIVLFLIALLRRNRRFLLIGSSFLLTVFAYSFMKHINCGMSGIARYNAWAVVVMIFAVVYFFDDILRKKSFCWVSVALQIISVFIVCVILSVYGPMRASKTSDIRMTPIAQYVLDNVPSLYNPLPSTFNTRVNGTGGGYDYVTPIVYKDSDGYIRKILLAPKDIEVIISELAGDDAAIKWFEKEVAEINREKYISIPAQYDLRLLSEYNLGSNIFFASVDKNCDKYVKKGLSHNEGSYAWTDGDIFLLEFRINDVKQYDYMHACFDIQGIYNGYQEVIVCVNGKEVAQKICIGGKLEFDFQLENTKDVVIELHLPDSISPSQLGDSIDTRDLALQLQKFSLMGKYYYEPLELGEKIQFYSEAYNASKYIQSGMSEKESAYSWTNGHEMQMSFKMQGIEDTAIWSGTYEMAGIYNNQQRVLIYVNGICVYADTISGGNIEFDFDAPPDGIVNIRMELPDAVSPLELGQSQDARKLALALKTFQITPAD